jgi:hypothetical protein
MATQPNVPQTEIIARLNDRARLGLDRTARVVFTRSCLAAFGDPDGIERVLIQAALVKAMRTSTFSKDSPERDLGIMDVRGTVVWVKIDYFDPNLEFGSENPADANITTRVLTVMLPSDW